jgi:probable phosphoglycerate mutase
MRHGDVNYFDENGRPYRPDSVPLNVQGRRQAEEAKLLLEDTPLDRVLSSDLLRSVETAQIVSAGRDLPLEMRKELREIEPGRLAEVGRGNVEHAFLNAFGKGLNDETRFLGGETFGSLAGRVRACLMDLLKDARWNHLLVVAHGGVNRIILGQALELDLKAIGTLEQDPGCINILDVDGEGNWIVRLMNFTAWNPAKKGLQLTTMERLYLQYLGERTD